MNVYGTNIPAEVLETVWDAWCLDGELTYKRLSALFKSKGLSRSPIPERAADRLLQKKRKAGFVEFSEGQWSLKSEAV